MDTILSLLGTLLSLIVVGTTLWVGLDASRLMSGIPKAKRAEIGGRTLGARSPAGWVARCMLLWIVYFPWYLRKRQKYLAFQREKYMEEYDRLKAEGAETISWEEAEASKRTPFPVTAFVLIAINVVVWSIMEGMGGSGDPSVLIRFGAQDNELVVAGEYWRLFTSMFLHIGLEHLALNCLALMLFAPIIESTYGRARFLGLYLVSGYFGNLLFLAFGQSTIVSAGASGAIFGVLGAHIPLTRRLKERGLGGMGPRGLAGLGYVVWVFVRSMGLGINVLAHFGGVIAGIVLGYVFCPVSVRPSEQQPAQPREAKQKLARRAVAIGLVLVALTVAGTLTSSAWRERVGTDGWHFAQFRRRAESPGSEPRIELRQKFPPARYEMVASEVTDTVMRMKGETEVSHSSETTWFDIRSSQPDASGATTCVMKIKRITQSDEDGSFDTDDPASVRRNPTGRVFSPMLGREFVLKFGPDWELVSASGLDEMWDALADAAEAETPGSGEFVRKQLKESLGDEGARRFLHLAYEMMPDKPVGVGAIWHRKESVKVPFAGIVRSDSELELTGIEETSDGKVAHIATTSGMRSSKGAETVLGPVSMTFRSMDLRQKATTRLNVDTGLLLYSESKASGGMRFIVRGPDGKRASGTMELSMTEETSVRPVVGKPGAREIVKPVRETLVGCVAGRVVSVPDGKPVSEFRISPRFIGRGGESIPEKTFASETGEFELKFLPPGTYRLQFDAEGHATRTLDGIKVQGDEAIRDLLVELGPVKFTIPEENLKIPEEMQSCYANFQRIQLALENYRKHKGEFPNWLSDLVPDYLSGGTLLCPNAAERQSPYWPDPNVPCSYTYEFSPTVLPAGWSAPGMPCRDWKARQMETFGNVVPIVRCHHHASEKILNLSVGGEVYCSGASWETLGFLPGPGSPASLSKPAPDFELQDLGGNEVRLSDHKGEVVLVHFWATWSLSCPDDVVALQELYEEYKDKGLAVVGISVDRTEDAVRELLKDVKLSYPIAMRTDRVMDDYGAAVDEPIKTIPTTIVVSKSGFVYKKLTNVQSKAKFEEEILPLLRIGQLK